MTTSISLIGFRSSRRRRSEIRFCGTVIGSRQCSPLFYNHSYFKSEINITLQLLAMDVSAQVTMKDAAKCDKRCEWQNSANQENAERILHFEVNPGSTSGWGHLYYNVSKNATSVAIWSTFLCVSDVKTVDASNIAIVPLSFRLVIASAFLVDCEKVRCLKASERETFQFLHQLR